MINTSSTPTDNRLAEQVAIGSLIGDENKQAVPTALISLDSNDFYRECHRIIWDCIYDFFMSHDGSLPKASQLAVMMLKKGLLEDAGGLNYLEFLSKIKIANERVLNMAISDIRVKSQTRLIVRAIDELGVKIERKGKV